MKTLKQKFVVKALVLMVFYSFHCVCGGAVRSYSVYQPEVTVHPVTDFNQGGLKYRHVVGIEHFKGKFISTFNANTIYSESRPGQACYSVWSDDGKNWGDIKRVTPITYVAGSDKESTHWQGSLFNYKDEELWFFWCEEPDPLLYMAVLKDPEGEWEHRLIMKEHEINGVKYLPFACNNAIVLSNGRIVLPINLQAYTDPNIIWVERDHLSAALISDDNGKTWEVDEKSITWEEPPADPFGTKFGGSWETMYVVQNDSNVRIFGRVAGQRLGTALGDKDARNFGPWTISSTRTISSRFWLGQYGSRRIMVHHDQHRDPPFSYKDRRNLAMYFSRTGGDDFVAGNTVGGIDAQACYPDALVHGDKLYVVYTYDTCHETRISIVDPLPDPEKYYVFPRGSRRTMGRFDEPNPEYRTEVFDKDGKQMLRLRGNAAAGLDIDALNPETDKLMVKFPIMIEHVDYRKLINLLTIGDGQIMLGFDNKTVDRLQICIDGKWQDAGPFTYKAWQDVKLEVSNKEILVDVNGSKKSFPAASAFNGRVYIGDGYPTERRFSQTRCVFDVSGLRTSVTKMKK